MGTTLEAPVDTKAQRAKVPKSDYAWPDAPGGPKYPITTQAQLNSAARLIGRAPADVQPKIKSRAKAIAKRKNFTLPKSWQAKKKGEAIALSDEDIRWAFQDALDDCDDPDADNDDDRDPNADPWDRPHAWVSSIIHDPDGTLRGVYSFTGDDDPDDDGLYQCTFTLDANGQVVLNNDIKRVVRVVTYADYEEQPEDEQGMEVYRESWTETAGEMTLTGYEAATGDYKGKITGQAIGPGFNRSKYRYYPKETLAAAVEGFAGKKMYINHPSAWDEKNRPERDVMEYAALIEKAWINTDGGISYTAALADPVFEGKLAHMQERGILSSIGTSVNYTGEASRETIEGIVCDRIESMNLLSLDFVTEAGAWGDVAHLESHAPSGATGGETREERDDMADDAVIKGLQEKIDALTASVGTLTERSTESEKRALKAEARAEVQKCLAESGLPKSWQERISKDFEGRESAEGIADRIVADIALYEEATGHKVGEESRESEIEKLRRARTAPKRVVIGNGSDHKESGERDVPKPGTLTESGSWLFGSREKAKNFEERFVS